MVKVKILLISLLALIFISTAGVLAIDFPESITEYFPITGNCSGEECNAKCFIDFDCGGNYYDNGEYYCKDGNVYWKRTFHQQDCNNGACYNITSFQEKLVEICAYGCENGKCIEPEEPECCEDLDCQEDYYSDKYCQDNKVYHDLYDFSCFNGKCIKNIIKELIKGCSDLCLDGECVNIFCKKNSDCGTDGFIGEKYCQDNKVYQDYKYFTCKNPGTINSSCSSSTTPKLIEECDYKCENGKCIEPEEPECCEDLDCGSSASELICIGEDVYNKTINPVCVNEECQTETNLELIEECDYRCENGKCIKEEEEKEHEGGGKRSEIDYCGDYFCDKEIGEDEISCYEDCKVSVAKISTSAQTTAAEETEANKIQLGNKFAISSKDKSISSLIFIYLLILTVILFIITIIVLLFKR